ncbi:hypothetical protein [Mycobacterium celatum]|uniref:hypothetical protein n=1 Tax=Mycobacterium celatum TaxID=28045 RepID=UPI00111C3CC6|nr:hypothetical protein [Mycobacterium celatum]
MVKEEPTRSVTKRLRKAGFRRTDAEGSHEDRRAAELASVRAQQEAADYANALAKAGVPVRDTAELLHVSPQRVSQLARSARR